MSSPKEDGTVAATEQIGSILIGESAERKDNETGNNEDVEENGTTPTKICSACDKESDALKKCRNCKCVWYCDKDCQNKHWKEHKKGCKRIKKVLDKRGGKLNLGTEKDVGPLGKLPSREECPICMHTLPIHAALHTYYACCGKSICSGCDLQHDMKSGDQVTCAFCRTPVPESDEEILARTRKRVQRKDPVALVNMAMMHGEGKLGLPVDQTKCIELMRQSADLGCPAAQSNLGNFYENGVMGLEQNEAEALEYWKKAAKGGHVLSRHNLGWKEDENGDHVAAIGHYVAAIGHYRLSASGGYKQSMEALIECFEEGFLHHADLVESLQTFYRSRGEMKSEGRDQYIAHLKETGEYVAENHDF